MKVLVERLESAPVVTVIPEREGTAAFLPASMFPVEIPNGHTELDISFEPAEAHVDHWLVQTHWLVPGIPVSLFRRGEEAAIPLWLWREVATKNPKFVKLKVNV